MPIISQSTASSNMQALLLPDELVKERALGCMKDADDPEDTYTRVSHQNMFFRKKINPTHSRGIWVVG